MLEINMEVIDSLIEAKWLIPIEPDGQVFSDYALVIHEGKIKDVLPSKEAKKQYKPQTQITRSNHVILPGLVNCHTHLAMTLLRGYADDLALMDWLQNYIWPAEQHYLSEDFVRDGVELALAELLLSGTTCFNDMYFYPDVAADVAHKMKIRGLIGLQIMNLETPWAKTEAECLEKNKSLYQAWTDPLIQFAWATHSIYATTPTFFSHMIELLDEYPLPIHMHIHETISEIEQSLNETGLRPLNRFHDWGLTSKHLIGVHMCHINEEDHKIVKESGMHVIHCPSSNMKLASGFCPIDAFDKAGVNIGLGTDGAASNNNLDMFEEMHLASLLAKGVSNDPKAIDAYKTLRIATLQGAKALGLDDKIGSLEIGKSADFIAMDLNDISCQPLYHPASQIVYASNRHQVSDVWVEGVQLVSKGELTQCDRDKLIHSAERWQHRLAS